MAVQKGTNRLLNGEAFPFRSLVYLTPTTHFSLLAGRASYLLLTLIFFLAPYSDILSRIRFRSLNPRLLVLSGPEVTAPKLSQLGVRRHSDLSSYCLLTNHST